MKLDRWLLTGILGSQIISAASLAAEDADTIDALKRQIQDLDQKVRVLERKQELERETATEKAKSAPSVSLGANGFSVRSADSNFVFKVRGYIQGDGRFYADEEAANDTFLIRRARPIFEGTVYEKFDFRLMLDFASGINSSAVNNGILQDAYLNARFLPEFQVQIGKFKEPVGLERLQSGANLLFIERGYPTQLVPNRDVGVQLQGDLLAGLLRYEAGVFNGVADGGSGDVDASDDEKDLAGRLFARPFKNSDTDALRELGLGVAGTWGKQDGSGMLGKYKSPGQQQFFSYRSGAGTAAAPNVVADGDHWRISPQFYYYLGSFGLFGEYVISDQSVRRDAGTSSSAWVENTAWQVSASYVLTGEENSWKGFTPKRAFNPAEGGWGAWEIAARVGQLEVDDAAFPLFADPATSASAASSWGVGLNWYLNKSVKFNFDYEQTDFDGGTSGLLEEGEHVFLTRAQISF
ncbi:MAG: OprO/OprP family phosphate-selective porin [Verrucomicrobia bacterium]|jgi:phosphate-selective porin OprO/OprP|nr:OprO/OprP family phosphate-selective porin [Verrucomicrobiota bacterium]